MSTNNKQYLGSFADFPKNSNLPHQHVTVEKDHQSYIGLIYQYHLFFQQMLFLSEQTFSHPLKIYISIK